MFLNTHTTYPSIITFLLFFSQFGNDDNTQPIMDDPLLEDNNVVEVVTRFENLISQQISFTAGEDVAIMGASDFSGENAHVSLSRFHASHLY